MSTRRLLAAVLLGFVARRPETAVAQTLAASPAQAAAQSDAAIPLVAFRLSNKSVIVGRIVRQDATSIVVDAGPAGQITLLRADVAEQIDPATLTTAPAPPPKVVPPPSLSTSGFSPVGKTYWMRRVNVGVSFTSAPFEQGAIDPGIPGLTGKAAGLPGDQYALQTQLSLFRSTNLQALDVEAGYTYASVQPEGKVTDLPKASVDYNFRRKDGQRSFILARYAWYKDVVRHIDYSHQALLGLGLEDLDRKTVKMSVVPVVGILRERRGIPQFDGRWLSGWGGLERLTITPNPDVQIEQREGFVQAFNDPSFRVVESTATFKGQIAKGLAITFSLAHMYDNVAAQALTPLPIPGVGTVLVRASTKTQVLTTGGLQITF
jgi:hypothetical protein